MTKRSANPVKLMDKDNALKSINSNGMFKLVSKLLEYMEENYDPSMKNCMGSLVFSSKHRTNGIGMCSHVSRINSANIPSIHAEVSAMLSAGLGKCFLQQLSKKGEKKE